LHQPAARATSRDLWRRLMENGTQYLGLAVERARGGVAEWTVCDKVNHADFGEAQVFEWSPISDIRSCTPRTDPGVLREAIDDMIQEGQP
jgi:hypothetical protein